MSAHTLRTPGPASVREPDQTVDTVTISEASPSAARPPTDAPLTAVALGRLLRSRLGIDDLEIVRRCHDLTGGDTGLVEHLVEALRSVPSPVDTEIVDRLEADPPPAVVEWIERRLAPVTPASRAVAGAIAVAGPGSTIARLAALLDRPRDEVRGGVAELKAAGVLVEETTLAYRSTWEASAVGALLDPAERRALHRRMASALDEHGGGDLEIARHLSATGPTGEPWAGPALLRAARQVARSGDHARAARWLRQALEEPLDEPDHHRVLDALARSESALGDPRALGRLRALADRTGAPEQRLRLARELISRASPCEAVAELDAMLTSTDDPALRRRIKMQLVTALRNDLDLRHRSHELAGELADELRADAGADAGALAEIAYEHVLAGTSVGLVLELAHRALEGARRGEVGAHQSQVLFLTLVTSGDVPGAQRLIRLREQAGDAPILQLHRRGVLAFALGEMEDAAAFASAALASAVDVPIMRPSVTALRARCLLRQGRTDDATTVLQPILADRTLSTLVTYHPVLLARAELARAVGDWPEALVAAEECADFSARMGTENPVVVPWHPVAAEALVVLGRTEEAGELASDALARIERFGRAPTELCAPLEDALARTRPTPAVDAACDVRIVVIGDGGVERDGGLVPMGEDLVDRALRYLAVHERPVLREELVEALWPDADPAAGRHRLRKLLSRLRSRHGELVVSTGSQLCIAPGVEVDLRRFRELARAARAATDPDAAMRAGRAALELARGDVLPLDRYDDWALTVDADHRREREQVADLVDGLSATRRADPSRPRQPPAVPT